MAYTPAIGVGVELSRQAVIATLLIYGAAAVIVAALLVLAAPGTVDLRPVVIVGDFIGRFTFLLVGSSIFPLIFWAFGRFRAEKAFGPLAWWGILGVVLALLNIAGSSYDGEFALKNVGANLSGFFSTDDETFIRVVKTSCVESRKHRSSPSVLSEEAFSAFCQCYAESLLTQLTVQEFRFALDGRVGVNPPPAWMQQKTGQAAIACQRFAVSP
jgi:hypothetical protein